MKAWILSDKTGNCPYNSLVWADTIGQAKAQANNSPIYMYESDLEIENWCDIRAVRCKYFDDASHTAKDEKNICIKLIEIFCWHFEAGNNYYDEDNIEEFKELFN